MRWPQIVLGPFLGCCLLAGPGAVKAEDADRWAVLPPQVANEPTRSPLYQRLMGWAEEAIQQRTAAWEKLKTPTDIAAWQSSRREIFLKALGGFPERSPLNAQVVGTLPGEGFRVEKVIFDSRPRHRITANLYLPLTPPPYPGVIVPCGHSYNGKAAEGYQRVSMLLAKNGIAALCYDPIGQGERYQTVTADGTPLGGDYRGSPSSVKQLQPIPSQPRFNPVEEHTLIGIGAILAGTNTAQYRIYDGMRAIDYLVSRPEIDGKRIGCTGNSGGGTLTAYLMALDDRITCAAPTCYLTTFRRLLHGNGPQDAEQNLFGQLRDGLDEADYVQMRAPIPIALCAGTRDATFDIVGTWDIFREGKRTYARLGFPERIDLVEADEPHGFTQPLRVGATRWMRRWLLHIDDAVNEPELKVFTNEQLQCTPHGQVMRLPGELSTFDLNEERVENAAQRRHTLWHHGPRSVALQRVRELAGIRPLANIGRAEWKKPAGQAGAPAGTSAGEVRVEKHLLRMDTGLELPALLALPAGTPQRRLIYLHSEGKRTPAASGELEKLAAGGALVLAVDLSGVGETTRRHPRDWGGTLFQANTPEFFLAYLLGKSLVGIRAEEILAAARACQELGIAAGGTASPVELVAVGSPAGIAATHAVALESSLFARVEIRDSLTRWTDVVSDPTAGSQLSNTVHAALTAYDLSDLR